MPESDFSSNRNKHLTLADRATLEAGLNLGHSFSHISRTLGKDSSTLAKEVKRSRHLTLPKLNTNQMRNYCVQHHSCPKTAVCGRHHCTRFCRSCLLYSCNSICPDFTLERCPKLEKAPFVCNACDRRLHCRREKFYYRAQSAHQRYRTRLSDTRSGIALSQDALEDVDTLVSPLLKRGQSIAHIYATHELDIPCSRKTLYRYIHNRFLGADNFDLPRKVRYKPRRRRCREIAPNPRYRLHRSYKDFTDLLAQHPDIPVVEMDTVVGSQCPEVLLTLFLRSCSLMLVFLLPEHTQKAVLSIFDHLESLLGPDLFRQIFPVILTDNGSEFKNPVALESSLSAVCNRTSLFFCDPGASWQKARIEKNHEFIRYVLPKGSSFSGLTQSVVDRLRDHINSTCRDTLNKNSPAALAEILLPGTALSALGLRRILPDEVCLKPALLKL